MTRRAASDGPRGAHRQLAGGSRQALCHVAVAEAFAPVVEYFSDRKDVTIDGGWTRGRLVLKVAKRIFAMSMSDLIVLKLPHSVVEGIVARDQGRRFDPRHDGRLMKEWVIVDPKTVNVVELAEAACAFVEASTRSSMAARRMRRAGAARRGDQS